MPVAVIFMCLHMWSQVRKNIPYQVIGGTPFWTRKEVKDLMAYIKLAINPEDDLSLMRTINQPTRGIGVESQLKLKAWAEGQGLSLGQALFPNFQVSLLLSKSLSSSGIYTESRTRRCIRPGSGIQLENPCSLVLE